MSETDGRLAVCFNKQWGTIDGNGWTHTETEVACKQLQLGYAASGTYCIFFLGVSQYD